MASAAIVVLVIRTRRPFYRSIPGRLMLLGSLAVVTTAFLLPYTPLGTIMGFEPLPLSFLGIIVLIVAAYIALAELVKKIFYKIVRD
jgi:P-type Mg2+ transporter